MQVKAIIYTRISKDRTGAGLGVERQESDCRLLAKQLGLEVIDVIVDNDLTAYNGKHRPGFTTLLRRMEAGECGVVLAWHADRIYRDTKDLERLIEVCDQASINIHTVQAGVLDLSNASGRMAARIYCAVQRHEVEHSIERIKAAKLQAAQSGRFSGGQRPYGWTAGRREVKEDEAQWVRWMAEQVTKGQSFNRVAQELNAKGIKTQHGKEWNALKVRNLLLHKAYAGIRAHHEAEYEAEWPAILTRTEWQRLQQAIRMHAELYKNHGPVRRNLLTGYIFCGACGGKMSSGQRESGQRRYVCINCYRILRAVEPVDLLIKESIIYRLDSPDLAKLLSQPLDTKDDAVLKELIEERDSRRIRLEELTDDYMAGLFTKPQFARAKTSGEAALKDVERQIQHVARRRSGVDMLEAGESVREAWDKASLTWRRQLVGLLIEKVVVLPSPGSGQMPKADLFMGKYRFNPEHISVRWLA